MSRRFRVHYSWSFTKSFRSAHCVDKEIIPPEAADVNIFAGGGVDFCNMGGIRSKIVLQYLRYVNVVIQYSDEKEGRELPK